MKDHLGKRTSPVTSQWSVVDMWLSGEWRVLEGLAINEASGTIQVVAQQSPDNVTWTTIATSAFTVVQGGQETFTIVVRRLRHFDPALGSFVGWVRGIAMNVLRNEWRRLERERDRLASAPPPPAGLEPDLGEAVAMAMAALPVPYRDVLRAKYQDELSVAEIAERFERTTKAVESMLSRARAAFRGVYRSLADES